MLVVGASGPLGRAVSTELGSRGRELLRVSRSGGAGTTRLDATALDAVREFLVASRPETVVYLARPVLDEADAARSARRAVDQLRDFAAIATESGVERLVFASSAAVYGTVQRAAVSELDAPVGTSAYALLKLESERVLADAARSGDLATMSLRIFNVYGPGFDQSLVNRLVLGDDPPPVVDDTEEFVRDYIHSSDVARAVALAMDAEAAGSIVVNVGTGVGTSNSALIALCPSAARVPSERPMPPSFSIADVSLIRSLWGFEAQVSVADAVREPLQRLLGA
ncbi:MAG: hypothetical protein JWN36_2068 [Microbacteriaceae bacterium]|nr:hypothetical protein [Microbacteriaceae bacterium]